ncbi:anti-sigma factor family protein [Fulvivirga sedimenti]|uniref:Zf-HC2 domain-containing protein n=1 Tax=Fulvivirga sedimenti TaxID=2879465 RepID=A0A9X1HM19_9BACT|nr:zf-HC2 domain-containing protein [Fulvivirga sedimenti]MCA6073313.1 zf-HC2 domain-containing protein [Fulvivirga sedimenti]
MTNTELINAYLDNELPEAERNRFEERLDKEPKLQQELGLHKDIIEGIRNARIADLKHRLDNVPVGGATGWSTAKVLTAVAVVAVTAVAIYFLYPEAGTTDKAMSDSSAVEQAETPSTVPNTIQELPEQKNIEEQPVEEENIIPAETEKSDIKKPAEEIAKQPENKRPVIAPSFENEESQRTEVTAPDGAVLGEVVSGASNVEVEVDRTMKNLDFHYAFDNNTLKLYGNFDDDLYEILEFNSNKGKRWFLSYQDKFYGLDSAASGVTPLQEITDQKLLNVLKSIQ